MLTYYKIERNKRRRYAPRFFALLFFAVLFVFAAAFCAGWFIFATGSAAPEESKMKAAVGLKGAARSASVLERRVIPPPEPEPAPAPDLSAPDPYFDDALFIGDSRTEGLFLYSNLSNATFYFSKGMSVSQVFEKANVTVKGTQMTVSDALGREKFGKVYVMLGLNELGWVDLDVFIDKYGQLIDRIKETQPGAPIYVQAIMPVTAKKSAGSKIYNNPNIDRFNALIKEMAADKGAVYLPVGESVQDGEGLLPEEATLDGVHLLKPYCLKWESYLRTHAVGK